VRRVRVGLLGYGRVGQAVATLADREGVRLREAGVELHVVGALVRDPRKPRGGPAVPLRTSGPDLFGSPFDLLIDVMGGEHPACGFVRQALDAGVHVVTANKTLVAAHGRELAEMARRRGVSFAYDAAVLAGVPFLGALARRPLLSAPRRMTGIINGTSHFIACRLERGGSFRSALDEATKLGYAEPDSTADISGRDASEKLTILAHLSGCFDLAVSDLTTCGLDTLLPVDVSAARALGGVLKPVALASFDPVNPGAWVGPALVDLAHPFARLTGVANAIEFAGATGEAVTFAGPGAGPRITAATILDDVVEALTGGRQRATTPRVTGITPAVSLRQPPAGCWYVRVSGAGLSASDLAGCLAAHGVPAPSLTDGDRAVAGRTGEAPWPAVCDAMERLTANGHEAIALPVIEQPRDS
jgi:homoserine dehydrogenase